MIEFLDLKKITASYGGSIEQAVARVAASGRYLHGPCTDEFEKAYASYIGTEECVSCGNGLDALTLILRAYIEMGRLAVGDEVIVPANTYIASLLAITENGLVPVPVDPDASTCLPDAAAIEKAVTARTKAVMIVHLYGRCAYSHEIGDLCRRHGLLLVEDNAQSHGCLFGGRRTGSLGDAAGHSFYPGKNLGALGDAGAVTTSDTRLAAMVRMLANYGSSSKYICDYLGRNSRMDEIQAAVLNIKLPRLDADNSRRIDIAGRYYREIHNPAVSMPVETPAGANVYHIFPVFTARRDELQAYLRDRGVATLIHYPVAPHLQKCYADMASMHLPVAGYLHASELSLPVSPVMTDDEVGEVIRLINDFS